ncbi:hypothetical protein EVJ58_g10552 [Rhodofomes roseus]|uniref:Aminotransferase class I/classII large domain-containing protein n=1 Tax=Rhodofomes roseus TaxID=34475 RepID=A0A4Y9XSG0_9APHY|nr:hypothetical protein EVJ58_g10552 [Rhodofomes roseus]
MAATIPVPHFNTKPSLSLKKADDAMKHMHHESQSEAHRIFRESAGHGPRGLLPQTVNPDEETVPGIQHPGSTGVIYCSDRAMANGFNYASSHEWSNLGQGAPEAGPIPDAPPRPTSINVPVDSLEYAPTTGVKELREAVAKLYNHTYREGKESQYTYENVCIVPGGRAGLSRVAAVIGDVYTSYQVPDYTAYDQVLSAFRRLVPVPTTLEEEDHYHFNIEQTRKDIRSQGLQVIIASNPRNPTGQVIRDGELHALVDLARETSTTLILDEFYSWYIYPENDQDYGKSVSSAEFIEDVNQDPVVIIDGLTKNWRLPGWRICWVVAQNLVTALSQSGSFLDGGANHPLQLAAIPPARPRAREAGEALAAAALQGEARPPTFYVWLDLEGLPAPINNGLTFFEELLKEKTIVIPGIFFDINPSHRRNLFNSPCHHFVRLSFGPPLEDLDKGGCLSIALRCALGFCV